MPCPTAPTMPFCMSLYFKPRTKPYKISTVMAAMMDMCGSHSSEMMV